MEIACNLRSTLLHLEHKFSLDQKKVSRIGEEIFEFEDQPIEVSSQDRYYVRELKDQPVTKARYYGGGYKNMMEVYPTAKDMHYTATTATSTVDIGILDSDMVIPEKIGSDMATPKSLVPEIKLSKPEIELSEIKLSESPLKGIDINWEFMTNKVVKAPEKKTKPVEKAEPVEKKSVSALIRNNLAEIGHLVNENGKNIKPMMLSQDNKIELMRRCYDLGNTKEEQDDKIELMKGHYDLGNTKEEKLVKERLSEEGKGRVLKCSTKTIEERCSTGRTDGSYP